LPQVLGGVSASAHHTPTGTAAPNNMVIGNISLLCNTLAMAVYYLTAKQLVMRCAKTDRQTQTDR
jgi:hypothetical protein